MRVTMRMLPESTKRIERAAQELVATRGRVVIATETPVLEISQDGQLYREVLLMEGARFRGNRNKIPIVDSHDDSTVANVLGSVKNIQINTETGEMFGEYSFASNEDGQRASGLIEEGHLTDFSITALKLEGFFVPEGKSYTTSRGVVVDGPAEIITLWEPHNASICATGKDENATVRRSKMYSQKERQMNEELMNKLIALGLPSEITDPQEIMAWLLAKLTESETSEPEASVESETAAMPEDAMVENMMKRAEDEEKTKDVEKAVERALRAEEFRRKSIEDDCRLMKIDRSFADQLISKKTNLADARKLIMQRAAGKEELGKNVERDRGIRFVESEDDKFYSAFSDVIVEKCLRAQRHTRRADAMKVTPEYKHWGLSDIAEEVAGRMGFPVRRMAPMEIARAVAGRHSVFHQYRVNRADAYHTIGSFSSLMLDAQNKTLLAAYEESASTWQLWARQAESVKDFKLVHRMRMSESPDLDAIPEAYPYTEGVMSDSRESYAVQKYGKMFSISLEAVINDDLDAFSRLPQLHGSACRRLQNKLVYGILTSNPVMSDTFNLFSASHPSGSNQSGSATAISVTSLNAAFLAMMTQKGPNGQVLGIRPQHLIVPVGASGTALQLQISTADPAVGGSTAGNANSANIYGPSNTRPINVIVEPLLDATSGTQWYLFADTSSVDTIELAFLQGEESPVLDYQEEFDTDTWKYKVRQTVGVKAIDWRGAYRNS
jgi:hypothetical protein